MGIYNRFLISSFLAWGVMTTLPHQAAGEAGLPSDANVVVAGCTSSREYETRTIAACGGKVVCIDKMIDCKFVDAAQFRTQFKSDPKKLDARASALWARGRLRAMMCASQNGRCPTDRDACANQPVAEIGCSLKQLEEPNARRPASELPEPIVMTGIVKAYDDESVTVLTQGRTVTVPKGTVQSTEYAMGDEVLYNVTSQRLVEFFFNKPSAEVSRRRGTSSTGEEIKRPPNMRRSRDKGEPITFDE